MDLVLAYQAYVIKKLIYPIGLLTVDEVVYMGVWNSANTNSFLYGGQIIILCVSRDIFNFVYNDRRLENNYDGSSELGVRPVISLKGTTVFSGSGTKSDPFVPKFIY